MSLSLRLLSQRVTTAFAASSLFLTIGLTGQQMVRDSVQSGPVNSSNPRQFLALGNRACFVADTAEGGAEPWVTDGTAAGTFRLRDLDAGQGNGSAQLICEFQGKALFSFGPAAASLALSDGTTAGTVRVPDLGLPSAGIVRLGNGRLLANAGSVTYATDLTAAGTTVIPGLREFAEGIMIGGISYGSCRTANNTYELWATDGTAAGSHPIAALPTTGRPAAFTSWNGRIYFQEGAALGPMWIASTDGVSGYTRHVQMGTVLWPATLRMFVSGSRLVFQQGGELTVSDLATAGPLAVPCHGVSELVEHAGSLYFRAASVASGSELWTTDGTVTGTTMVSDLMPGTAGSHPAHMLSSPAGLVFSASLPTGRRLLRLSPPSSIADLGAIPADAPSSLPFTSPISAFVPFGGGLLFGGTDAAGTELWRYDGAQSPARLLDIDANGPGLLVAADAPRAAMGDRVFFLAYEQQSGLEPWSSNGTAAGTQVLDLTPGAQSEFSLQNGDLVRFGDRVALRGDVHVKLTDGTLAGTTTLPIHRGLPQNLPIKVRGDAAWFVFDYLQGGLGLYRTDGTPAGTTWAPIGWYGFEDFEVLTSRIVITADNEVVGTDGVTYPQPLGVNGAEPRLYRLNDDALLVGTQSGLFVTDGTASGTSQLATLTSSPSQGVVRNGIAWLLSGGDVWQCDGTAAGTSRIGSLPATATGPTLLVNDHDVFVTASTPLTGRELWRLDRATMQFVLAVDLAPGPWSGVVSATTLGSGNLLLVMGGNDATGVEPYVSDGTAAGTRLLADINPGRGNSNPQWIGIAGDTVFLIADDGVHGAELWSMPLAVIGAASVQAFGVGCLGSLGYPRLSANELPQPGAFSFALALDHVRPLSLSALALATDLANTPVSGCNLLVGGSVATVFALANVAGSVSFGLPLPANPALVGARFVTQGFALDAMVPRGFAASEGVIVVLGR
jgi:ELWxxDGT repeat protein